MHLLRDGRHAQALASAVAIGKSRLERTGLFRYQPESYHMALELLFFMIDIFGPAMHHGVVADELHVAGLKVHV